MAKKKGEKRLRITLVCSDCGARNYSTYKNRVNTPSKLELRKFCKNDRTITVHKESK